MKTFDTYEIHPCHVIDGAGNVEQCDPEQAQFWSLYGHVESEGLECIGDFISFEAATDIYFKITGKQYDI